MNLEIGRYTHLGQIRDLNEDSLGVASELGVAPDLLARKGRLFAVADGMGGHAAGEVASQLAIDALFEAYYQDPDSDLGRSLTAAFQLANDRVYQQAQDNEAQAGMGTTLVAAVLHEQQWLIANAGDSRAYLVRQGKAQQITRDHSWVAEQVAAGVLTAEQGRNHPYRNVVTRSLGQTVEIKADLFTEPAWPGDALLLCSDGLSNLVAPEVMAYTMSAYPAQDAAMDLVRQANQAGGFDNITAVVVKLAGNARPADNSGRPLLVVAGVLLALLCVVLTVPALQQVRGLLATSTPTATPSPTLMPTSTPSATASPTLTSTSTPTATASPTLTSTSTPTATPSPTLTSTSTPTATATPVATANSTVAPALTTAPRLASPLWPSLPEYGPSPRP